MLCHFVLWGSNAMTVNVHSCGYHECNNRCVSVVGGKVAFTMTHFHQKWNHIECCIHGAIMNATIDVIQLLAGGKVAFTMTHLHHQMNHLIIC
jgi:uracil DNA glycosylase